MSAPSPPRRYLAATTDTAQAIATRHGGGDRPHFRPDAIARRQVQMGEVRWMVKNTETMKFYVFEDHEWRLIELFDGTRTRPEIVEEYNARYSFDPIDVGVILEYEEMLRKIDLLEQSAAERSLTLLHKFKTARQRAAEEKAEGFNIFFLLFKVMDPERFLERTVKYVRWIWTPPVVIAWSIAVAWTAAVFILNWEPIFTGTYELYAFLRKPLIDVIHFFFILSFIGFFHEFGHAYAVKIYGGGVHDIGIALLYFTPAFYCDTTDALLFPNKWHRLWVNTAGIYVEGFICAAATALWVASYPDTLVNELAYKTMLFTGISTIFFNVNPLIKIDGYHALTSLLEMPDLREESFKYIGAKFQKHVLRLPVEIPPTTRRRRRIYWIYGTLALAYVGVIMSFIAGVFSNLYQKLFPDVAVILLMLTLYKLFRKRVRLVTRTARLFYLDKKDYLMSPKSRKHLAIAVAVFLALVLVPWSRRTVSAESVLRPRHVATIEAPEDAFVTSVLAREGDPVSPGQELFRLSSAAADSRARRDAAAMDRFVKAAGAAREAGSAEGVFATERRGAATSSALASDRARAERLAVKSPISGQVLTPRTEDLDKRFVSSGTVLAEVGDCRQLIAELPVSERLLDDLYVGAPVRALLRQRPLSPVRGVVSRISPATLGQPATSRAGADPTLPPGRPDRFVAVAVFENPGGALKPGSLVRAKIYSHRTPYAARVWRVLHRWAQTVVW
ncbi:MAG: HlyD family efflux transporter periplasmic adaptor subunit [Thermoanaerobaculia bacterium]